MYGAHLNLPLPNHSFPTRRSSYRYAVRCEAKARCAWPRDPMRADPEMMRHSNTFRGLAAARENRGGTLGVDPARIARPPDCCRLDANASMSRSEEHTSELQSLMRISYAVFCLKQKKTHLAV